MSKLDVMETLATAAQQPPSTSLASFRKFPFRSQSLRNSPNKKSSSLVKPNSIKHPSPDGAGPFSSASSSSSSSSSSPSLSRMEITGHQLVMKPQPLFVGQQRDSSRTALLARHQSMRFVRTQSLSSCPAPVLATPWSATNFIVTNAPPENGPVGKTVVESGWFDDEGVDLVSDGFSDDGLDGDDDSKSTGADVTLGNRVVTLIRNPRRGLGLTVTGGGPQPLIILSIRPDSPAQLSGDVYIGDQIVSVNEVPINETTSHQDALRLLTECGHLVSLVLKHSKAVMNHQKRWRQKKPPGNIQPPDSRTDTLGSFLEQDPKNKNSVTDECRVSLFLAGVSQYVSYSDQLRDCGFELQTNTDHDNDRSFLVVRCITKEIGFKWFRSIRSTIDHLTHQFVQGFNRNILFADHIFYMSYVSELVGGSPPFRQAGSLTNLSLTSCRRWLPRYLIIKGGKVYLFKKAPRAIIIRFQRRIQALRMNNGNGSSLGSMGSASSASETSNGSNYSTLPLAGGVDRTRPDRMNRCLEKELDQQAIAQCYCYEADFRPVKPEEQVDGKNDCFLIYSEKFGQRYFSTESQADLYKLNQAWNVANYISVIKNEKKFYTVVWEKENIIGSLKVDWNHGFSFYDPAQSQYLWSYRFYQLKHSSDDGLNKLSLTFITDPNDSRIADRYILRCSCLQNLIYCIHAFLRAKVFSLDL